MRHNNIKTGLLVNWLRFGRHIARAIPRFFGDCLIECPCCGRKARFLAAGNPPRYDALCKYCGSYERHRLVFLWLKSNTESFSGKRILHFAPEELIENYFRSQTNQYIAANYSPVSGGVNVENLEGFSDNSIDVVICSHVLEHVDDVKALSEIHRVLVPQGQVLLMFPIIEGWEKTLELSDLGKPVLTTEERALYFGQSDHIRYFGRDVRQRIFNAGFSLEEFTAVEPLVSTYGLMRGEKLFIATKSPG